MKICIYLKIDSVIFGYWCLTGTTIPLPVLKSFGLVFLTRLFKRKSFTAQFIERYRRTIVVFHVLIDD